MSKPMSEEETIPQSPEGEPPAGGDELQEIAEAARRQAWQDPLQSGR